MDVGITPRGRSEFWNCLEIRFVFPVALLKCTAAPAAAARGAGEFHFTEALRGLSLEKTDHLTENAHFFSY